MAPAEITLNGKRHSVAPQPTTIRSLLAGLDINPAHVVVEVNGTIVRKAEFESHMINTGDAVEVVRFVGGG